MLRHSLTPFLDHLRAVATPRDAHTCDAELLNQFISRHEERAFETLLHRHGPMVLRVARRVLGRETDAEDVLQATFLLLAKRAASIRKRDSVASWLHGVAHRLALSARADQARRRNKERVAAQTRTIEISGETGWNEFEEALHNALTNLPAKYRTPLVYCYLEGRTQEDVARELGVPLGTVRSWVARGRELLRKRLLRRGVTLSVEGASAALLASACSSVSAMPTALLISTAKAARLYVSGGSRLALVSPHVATLVRRAATSFFLAKLQSVSVCLFVLTLLAVGSGWAAYRALVAPVVLPNESEIAEQERAEPQTTERPRVDAQNDPLPPGAVGRLGTVRFRHEKWLGPFALSPDGRTVAAVAGRSVAFWDVSTGRLVKRLKFEQEMTCLTYSPDGKSVAIGGQDCIVRLIELSSGKRLFESMGHQRNPIGGHFDNSIWGVAFTPDGGTLVSWASDNTVRLWDTRTGKAIRQLACEYSQVSGLSPDGKLLAGCKKGAEKTLILWDLTTDREVRRFELPDDVFKATFSPDNETVAVSCGSFGKPGEIVLYRMKDGKELGTLTGHENVVFALAFSSDGKKLASAGYDQALRFWDLQSHKQLRKVQKLATPVYQLAFCQENNLLVSRGAECHVRLWNTTTGDEKIVAEGPGQSIVSLAYSPNGEWVAAASCNRIWIWNPSTSKVVRTFVGNTNYLSSLVFTADGQALVSADQQGMLRIWDVKSGKERRRIQSAGGGAGHIALSADAKLLASWGPDARQEIHLWDAETGEKRRMLKVPTEPTGGIPTVCSLCFAPDGKSLYAASGTHVFVLCWDVTTGKLMPSLGKHDGGLSCMTVAPDGRSLAAVTLAGTLYLWETATREARLIAKGSYYADSLAFAPDGRTLALASAGNHYLVQGAELLIQGVEEREKVRIVRVADGKVIRNLTGHLGSVGSLGFSPDGRRLASGGHDTTVLLWDVEGLREKTTTLEPAIRDAAWTALAGTAEEAHGGMTTLIASSEQATAFFADKLKPVVAADAAHLAELIRKLDSDPFREREEATNELKKLGDAAEPAIRKALQENLPLETRRRLQSLLPDANKGERLRTLRAIEVLERIGDRAAREVLRRLANGAAGAWLTDEARTTIQRLK